ncbi:MAG: DNA internalization-related competence protein ComEC/Rec2 [Acidobacteria bacterium]|nr:DNA internalization-related competence protein ComEC/Rec2 [Acidobacteriota bacterium]
MYVPAALAAIPLLAGSAAGLLLGDVAAVPPIAAAAAFFALIAALTACADSSALEFTISLAAGCLLAGISLGGTFAASAYRSPLRQWFDAVPVTSRADPVIVEGVLREDAGLTSGGASLIVSVDRVAGVNLLACRLFVQPDTCGARLTISGGLAFQHLDAWRAGRRIRVPATVRVPVSYINPGVPDDPRALARRGVSLVGSVKSAQLVEVTGEGTAVRETAAAARAWARRQIAREVGRWSPRSAGVVAAILLGDRTGLSDEDERRLQDAGTYHVIAISGGNIAILAAVVLLVLRGARMPPAAAFGMTIVVLLAYGRITIPAASVDRAITAATVFLAGRLLDHRGPPLNALAVAAIFAVAVSPAAPLDAGFLLSFGATLGILLVASRILAWPGEGRSTLSYLGRVVAGLLVATICADIALAPISAAVFGRITFAGLLLNFAAIPLMTVVQVAGITVLAAASWPTLAAAAGFAAHLASNGLIDSARLVEAAPWMAVHVPAPAWWLVTAYYSCCALALTTSRCRRLTVTGAALAGMGMLAGPVAAARDAVPPATDGVLRVVFLDVGQGDATVALLPRGRAVLVDAGGLAGSTPAAFDIGERVVVPALRAFGVRQLDALVLTHGDPDHVGGAPAVIRQYAPRAVWEGIPVPQHAGLRQLGVLADAGGGVWRRVQAGGVDRIGTVEIAVLHPPPPEWERQRVRNEDSVVLELRIGEVSVVLPGDIGREGEMAALSRLPRDRLVIVKAPHHGSATSSTQQFIDALAPAAVIFSAGRANRFGHPAPSVVERYRVAGAAMFSTAQDGAVILDTDGRTVEIRGWTGRSVVLKR